jgi:general L-amino acid transport system permease protein
MIVAVGYSLISNASVNLEKQKISKGFSFLTRSATFEIGESLISYSPSSPYAIALLVGLLNTLKVSMVGIILAVLLGTLIGIARLSSNWLISKASALYIEIMQNIPVLLQLFFWYAIFYNTLPTPNHALSPIPGTYLSNRGISFSILNHTEAYDHVFLSLIIACVISLCIYQCARIRQKSTGRIFPTFWVNSSIIVGSPAIVWIIYGAPVSIDSPQLVGFNFCGGVTISPEFMALLLGLVLYTAAFVAEVVRAGIQAVSRGQKEAAMSIGLRPSRILWLIVLPQALRVIIPPLTSQMLNLIKNSSLAVAIGYPDFVSIANTTINQTGQAIEGVALMMFVYLLLSLITSAFMNWYNRKTMQISR